MSSIPFVPTLKASMLPDAFQMCVSFSNIRCRIYVFAPLQLVNIEIPCWDIELCQGSKHNCGDRRPKNAQGSPCKEKHPTPQWPSLRRIYRITSIANPGNGERAVSLLLDELQSCCERKKRGRCYLKVGYEEKLWSDEGSLMVHLVVTAVVFISLASKGD